MSWIERPTYWLSTAPQGSEEWLSLRQGILTASDFGAAVGRSKFSTPHEVALDRSGVKKKVFSDHTIAIMKHGSDTEDIARTKYMSIRGVVVDEVGLAIWKENPSLGASLDGDVRPSDHEEESGGMLEIKCPYRMYRPLKLRAAGIPLDYPADPHNYNRRYPHIWPTHYAQMQGCMAICNKQWCDYFVYAVEDNMCYLERIPFDPDYWAELYEQLSHFLVTELLPLVRSTSSSGSLPLVRSTSLSSTSPSSTSPSPLPTSLPPPSSSDH